MAFSKLNVTTATLVNGGTGDARLEPIERGAPVVAPASGSLLTANRRSDSALEILLQRLQSLLIADGVIALQVDGQRSPVVIGVVGDEQDPHVLTRCMPQLRAGAAQPGDLKSPSLPDSQNSWVIVGSDPTTRGGSLLLEVPLDRTSSIFILAGRYTPCTSFVDVDFRAAQQAVPWITDYIAVWWQLQQERKRSTGLQGSLDQVGLPMIRLDGDAQVIGINSAARELLACDDGLVLVGNVLTAANLQDNVKFQAAIKHVMIGVEPGTSAPVLAIRRTGDQSLIVTVLRVPPGRRRDDTAVVLQIVHPELERSAALTAVCTLFGLSGAETRLATLLATGLSLADAAMVLRVQLPTARAYLRQAFDKTGTNRQAALVHLLMANLMHPAPGTKLRVI